MRNDVVAAARLLDAVRLSRFCEASVLPMEPADRHGGGLWKHVCCVSHHSSATTERTLVFCLVSFLFFALRSLDAFDFVQIFLTLARSLNIDRR